MNVGFIGIGKLGLACAETMASKHNVTGYDIYPRESSKIKIANHHTLIFLPFTIKKPRFIIKPNIENGCRNRRTLTRNLNNLLNIIGRREGARSVITLG